MSLYSLRTSASGFAIAKFDDDLNVLASYSLTPKGTGYACDCPAGGRVKLKPCKHQRMLPFMLGAVNTGRFYDPETKRWAEAIAVDNPNGVIAEEIDPQPTMAAADIPKTNTATVATTTPVIRRRV